MASEVPTWGEFIHEVQAEVLTLGLASYGCSILLIALFCWIPRMRRTPGTFVRNAAWSESLVSLGFVLLYFFGQDERRLRFQGRSYVVNWVIVVIISGFEVNATGWRTVMYWKMVTIYRNPFNPERRRILYPLIVWGLMLAQIAACAMVFATVDKDRANFLALLCGLYIFPFCIFLVLGGALYSSVAMLVYSALRTAGGDGHPASISTLAQQRVMKHGTAYLMLYGTQLILGNLLAVPLCFNMSMVVGSKQMWWHLLTILTCGRPIISLVGWGIINDLGRLQKGRPNFIAAASATPPHLSAAQLLPAVGPEGVDAATIHEMEKRAWVQGVQEAGFKAELRFELLFDVAKGIGRLAQEDLMGLDGGGDGAHDLEAGAGGVQRGAGEEDGAPADRLVSFQADYAARHAPDEAPADRLASLPAEHAARRAPDEVGALPPRTPTAGSDCSTERAFEVLRTSSDPAARSVELRRARSNVSVNTTRAASRATHYEKERFGQIRRAFGINPHAYSQAFPNDLSESDPNWRHKLKESVSEGASGSFFYRVLGDAESQFIVKQITAAEKDTLTGILPEYESYVQRQQGRTLIQYFGCHSVPLRWKLSGKVYFVVMRNFIPGHAKPWLVFDLKGATANRRALDPRHLHERLAGADPTSKAEYGTLRDWEWMDVAMAVDIPAQDKESIQRMIESDADFLSSQNLLDYSLLVGIHRLPADLSPLDREARLGELRRAGGYVSISRQKVYFFGIIDVLERYTLGWRMQNAVLVAAYHLSCQAMKRGGISAMPPHDYAGRFKTFVKFEVLHEGDDDDDMLEACRASYEMSGRCGWCCCPRRPRGLPLMLAAAETGHLRWRRLWVRRRRGLVRECIEAEREDYIRRIHELQRQQEALARLPRSLSSIN